MSELDALSILPSKNSSNLRNSISSISISGEVNSPNSGKKYYIPRVNDSDTPAIGMQFSTIEEAFLFYKNYAKLGGFEARKSTVCTKNGIKTIRYIVCSKQGTKKFRDVDTTNDGAGVSKQFRDVDTSTDGAGVLKKRKNKRKKASKRTGCNAQIRVSFNDDFKKYVVYGFTEQHNHPFVVEEDQHLLSSDRNLTFTQQQFLFDVSNLNIGPVKAFNLLKVRYGGFEKVGASVVECKNFKRDFNMFIGDFDVDMAVRRLMKKKEFVPDFSCEFFTNEEGSLAGLFWADDIMKKNYSVFGDVVSFDATFRTNRYGLVFVPFTGIDNHYHNVTFAGSLLSSETTESYKWLLRTFLKCFGQPSKVVVTDQDPAMKIAVREILPTSRHRLCMWHIMMKLVSKVGVKVAHDERFKKALCEIVWTDAINPAEFEDRWCNIIKSYDLEGNKWLSDMYDLRNDWIPAYYRHEHMSGLMRTTSRSESENHFFGQLSNTRLTLVEFLSHFETAIESQRHTHTKNDHVTRYTEPDIITNYELEGQAKVIFTRKIFYDVQDEISTAIDQCMCKSCDNIGVFAKFEVKEVDRRDGSFEVLFDEQEMDISCSCNRFEQYGLLCRHIFYVLRLSGVKVFPEKYIMNRWRRDAVSNKPTVSASSRESTDDTEDVSYIVRDINISTDKLVNLLVQNKEELLKFRDYVKDAISKASTSTTPSQPITKSQRFANIIGSERQTGCPTIRAPVGIRNKGSGSHKRMKSSRELETEKAGTTPRTCQICHQTGHNRRSCKNNPANN